MKGELVLNNNAEVMDTDCSWAFSYYDFGLSLFVDQEKTLEKQLSNTSELLYAINDHLDYLYELEPTNINEIDIYKSLKENISSLYENVEFVKLNLDNVSLINFIENNPILKNKKIVIPEEINVTDKNKIYELLSIYDKYKENIYVPMANNTRYVSLMKCLEIMQNIKTQADEIMALGLSPMEIIMYTYDLVRNRVYKSENDSDSPELSRDLSNVLFGNKIVCVGYSNLFSALLNYMGIDCYNERMDHIENRNEAGHERNIVYVKDKKYDIDGVYYFDATWDSRRENETNEFLNRYLWFAKTIEETSKAEKNQYEYESYKHYSPNIASRVKKLLDNNNLAEICKLYYLTIYHMFKKVNEEQILEFEHLIYGSPIYNQFDRTLLISKLTEIQKKLNDPIPAETFIELFNNVRKIQHYQNPDFYPYSVDKMYETYIRSNWTFKTHHYAKEETLLMTIFGCDSSQYDADRNHRTDDFNNYIRNYEINKEISQVELTKVLKKQYNKPSNDSNN